MQAVLEISGRTLIGRGMKPGLVFTDDVCRHIWAERGRFGELLWGTGL